MFLITNGGIMINKTTTLISILLTLFIINTHAQFSKTRVPSTVEGMEKLWDETLIVSEGYLIKKKSGGVYIFEDDTGKIEVKINNDFLKSRVITPKTKIKIFGIIEVLWPSENKRILIDYLEVISEQPAVPWCD